MNEIGQEPVLKKRQTITNQLVNFYMIYITYETQEIKPSLFLITL